MIKVNKRKFLLILFLAFWVVFIAISILEVQASRPYKEGYLQGSIKDKVRGIKSYLTEKIDLIIRRDELYVVETRDISSSLGGVIVKGEIETISTPLTLDYLSWYRSSSDNSSAKYSGLQGINRSNINSLKISWVYSGDQKYKSNVQATPIYTGRYLVFPDASHQIVALNPTSGQPVWSFNPKIQYPARRGLTYKPVDVASTIPAGLGQIFFTAKGLLFCLMEDGTVCEDWDSRGHSIGYISKVAPAIFGEVVLVSSQKPAIHAFDIKTGKELWSVSFSKVPSNKRYPLSQVNNQLPGLLTIDESSNSWNWGGFSVDEQRAIAFVTTSNPGPVGNGIFRQGVNSGSGSLIAIDLNSREVLWAFQTVFHDLWDLDVSAPPILTSIKIAGKQYDVVVVVTKTGETFVIDRVTGKSVFDLFLKPVPTSSIRGERTFPYQLVPVKPDSFGGFEFNRKMVTNLSPDHTSSVLDQLDDAVYGFFQPPALNKKIVFFGLHGNANQMGAAIEPTSSRLVVTASREPSFFVMRSKSAEKKNRILDAAQKEIVGKGASIYKNNCLACHGKLGGGGGVGPDIEEVSLGSLEAFVSIMQNGIRAMPPQLQLNSSDVKTIYKYLQYELDFTEASEPNTAVGQLRRESYQKLLDFEGYPASLPPWGTISMIDLNTGDMKWQQPFGHYRATEKYGLSRSGTENLGAPILLGNELIAVTGTKDRMLAFYDLDTGKLLREIQLPYIGSASPMTFMHERKQYLVVPATGGGTLALYDNAVETGNAFVALSID